MKLKPKIKIDKGYYICEDIQGYKGIGLTPREAWLKYKENILDRIIQIVYNYEHS